MFPQDVPNEVRGQLEEAVFAQRTERGSVHAELLEVHALQAELVHSPHHPVPHVGLCPLPGVCGERAQEDPARQAPSSSPGLGEDTEEASLAEDVL